MKKFSVLSLMICLSIFANAASPSEDLKVIKVCHLTTTDQEFLIDTVKGLHPEVAIEFPAETSLPLSCFLTGDLINFTQNWESLGQLEIKQTFYARCIQEEFLFSSDLAEWKPFLEFATGLSSVGLSFNENGPLIFIGAEANRRG